MYIPLSSKRLIEHTPLSLKSETDADVIVEDPAFLLRVPTMVEREQIGARLTSLGIFEVSELALRSTMIDALWDVFPADKAEEHATFLDGYEQRRTVYETMLALWKEQEIQRQEDEMHGAPAREPYPLPVRTFSVRDEARANLMMEEMVAKSDRIRDLLAKRRDHHRIVNLIMFRMHVAGVKHLIGTDGQSFEKLDIDVNGLLDENQALLIQQVIGNQAWRELHLFIDGLYSLTDREEKNSDSPLGKLSDPSGSPALTVASDPSDGNLTTSNITALPIGSSEATTAPLSLPISEPAGSTVITSPTDAA
jgi:hypothetical protein